MIRYAPTQDDEVSARTSCGTVLQACICLLLFLAFCCIVVKCLEARFSGSWVVSVPICAIVGVLSFICDLRLPNVHPHQGEKSL